MLVPGSRYEHARPFTAPAGQRPVFPGLRPREIPATPGVVEHTVEAGDRLDRLAQHYYDRDRLWWRIVDANPDVVDPADLLRDEGVRDADGAVIAPSRVGGVLLVPAARA